MATPDEIVNDTDQERVFNRIAQRRIECNFSINKNHPLRDFNLMDEEQKKRYPDYVADSYIAEKYIPVHELFYSFRK
jgi:hypothetical protein